MTAGAGSFSQIDRLLYVQELIEFRSALRQSDRDNAWIAGSRARRLVYLVDTNLTYLYFRPTLESRVTRVLSAIPESENDHWIAVITSHFLFNGKLPGRGEHPLLIDPAHLREFSSKLTEIATELLTAARQVSDAEKQVLRRQAEALRARIEENRDSVSALRRIFDGEVRGIFAGAAVANMCSPKLLQSLMRRKDLIRPVGSGPYLAGLDVSRLDETRVAFWTEQIRKSAQRPDLRSENITRDAECLARLEKINAHLAKGGVDVRYVLITADRLVLNAVRRNAVKFAPDDPGSLVRDLLQFIPLGNIRDIGENMVDSTQATQAIEHAIDALFSVQGLSPEHREARIDELHELASMLRKIIRRAERDEKVSPEEKRRLDALARYLFPEELSEPLAATLDTVREHWSNLVANTVSLNNRLLVAHYSAWLSDLLATIDAISVPVKRDLGSIYEGEQLAEAEELSRTHIHLVLSSGLSSHLKEARHWAQRGMGLMVPVDMAQSPLWSKVGETIRLMAKGSSNQLDVCVEALCHASGPIAEVTVAGAAVALQAGFWHVAAELARLSRKHVGQGNGAVAERVDRTARMIEILALRAEFMESGPDEDGRYRRALKRRQLDVETLRQEYVAAGNRPAEALLHAEQAWDVAMQLSIGVPAADRTGLYDAVALHTGRCFDIAQQISGTVDMAGKSVATTALARSSAALLLSMLDAAQAHGTLPTAAHGMLDSAADFLLGRDRPPDDESGGVWSFLGRLALHLYDTEPGESVRLPRQFREDFDALRQRNMVGLRRELDFLDRAMTKLAT